MDPVSLCSRPEDVPSGKRTWTSQTSVTGRECDPISDHVGASTSLWYHTSGGRITTLPPYSSVLYFSGVLGFFVLR